MLRTHSTGQTNADERVSQAFDGPVWPNNNHRLLACVGDDLNRSANTKRIELSVEETKAYEIRSFGRFVRIRCIRPNAVATQGGPV